MNTNKATNQYLTALADATINHQLDGSSDTYNQLLHLLLQHDLDNKDYQFTLFHDPEYKALVIKHIEQLINNNQPAQEEIQEKQEEAADELTTAVINRQLTGDWATSTQLNKVILKYDIESDDYLTTMYKDPAYRQLLKGHITQQLSQQPTNTPVDEETTDNNQQQPDEPTTTTNNHQPQEEELTVQQVLEEHEPSTEFQTLKDAYDSDDYRTLQAALKPYKSSHKHFKLNSKKAQLKEYILQLLDDLTEAQHVLEEYQEELNLPSRNQQQPTHTMAEEKQPVTPKILEYTRKQLSNGKLSTRLTPKPRRHAPQYN